MNQNRRIQNKKEYKDIVGECVICGEDDRSTLEIHRIVEGENGGKYTEHNSICICSSCHSKVHHGSLEIVGKYKSTAGDVLIYKDAKTGEEHVKKC